MEIKKLSLLPAHPSKCQCCAVEHKPDQPHNPQSLYYAFWFNNQHGRSPTWADAMAHCPDDIKAKWTNDLQKIGVDIHSTNLTGDIKSNADLESRLNPQKAIQKLNKDFNL